VAAKRLSRFYRKSQADLAKRSDVPIRTIRALAAERKNSLTLAGAISISKTLGGRISYTCFVEEVPAAISQGETLGEAKAKLVAALKLVLECQRELAEKDLSPNALREPFEFADA
jgi:predicted RNase H-like HicB family nuclease